MILLTLGVIALNVSVSVNGDLTKTKQTTELEIENNEANSVNITLPNSFEISDGEEIITVSLNQTVFNEVANGETVKALLTRGDVPSDFELGEHTKDMDIDIVESENASVTDTKTETIIFVNSFCEAGENGTLEISDLDIDNLDGDDDEWQPLDEVELSIDVENTGNDEVEDVILEIMVLDDTNDDVTGDFDFDDEEIDLGDIDEDEEETGIFKIGELSPEVDDGDYRIFIKAYSEDDEELNCIASSSSFSEDIYHQIIVEKEEENAIVVQDYDALREAQAGDSVEVTFNAYNIGEEEEDDVLVTLRNSDLGVDEREHIRNFDVGDKEEITFSFKIPEDAEGDTYNLNIYTYFDYDDGDVFEESSYDENSLDDLDETYRIRLEVTELPEPELDADITAELVSEKAVAGQELVIQATITNTGEAETTYSLDVSDYDDWATLENLEQDSLTLGPQDSEDFDITFNVNEETIGEQMFTITTEFGEQEEEQEVSVVIEEQGFGFTGDAIAEHFRDNWFIWLIAVINIILIIAIIIVARRISVVRQ
jgi:hypothetical protein